MVIFCHTATVRIPVRARDGETKILPHIVSLLPGEKKRVKREREKQNISHALEASF